MPSVAILSTSVLHLAVYTQAAVIVTFSGLFRVED